MAIGDCSINPVGLLMRSQEALHFRAHGIFLAARHVEKRHAIRQLAFERAMEDLFDAGPVIHSDLDSSAYNHALASVHSLPTVAGDMSITSAVSSIVRPPKKRSSTTRLC